MKQERTKKKVNGLLVFSAGLLAVAIATPLTFALFTDKATTSTSFTFGKIQIDAGKTTINTSVTDLLPGDGVLASNVVVAKDLFSQSYILRANYNFTVAAAQTNGMDTADVTAYTNALNGKQFTAKDADGKAISGDKDGLAFQTQAVDSEGKIYVSTFDIVSKKYTLTATNKTVGTGYAKNYRWYYYDATSDNTDNGYFYLCNYFNAGSSTAETVSSAPTIKNVEMKGTVTGKVSVSTAGVISTADNGTYDLDTKPGRDALVNWFENTYTTTGKVSDKAATLTALKSAVDSAYTSLNTARKTFKATPTAENKTALATAEQALSTAITQYETGRNDVASKLADYQDLYVFAMGGDYNKVPTDLYQPTGMTQWSGASFTLSMNFEAVQSANLTGVTISSATPTNVASFF